jgi:maltooligosyltrehalose trehalohydrolase
MPEWTPTLGAIVRHGATTFRLWAPDRSQVDLVVDRAAGDRVPQADERPLMPESGGYWTGRFTDLGAGTRYTFRLDGRTDLTFPDPASRHQPDGVHAASAVVDPATFLWTDAAWRPPSLRDVVFYELHVGTFTPHGTFRAAIERLPYLRELGVTAVELMPLGDFPGSRNWGYDGVAIFAPARCYGTPDELRAFVDAAHGHQLAVFIDVVYNHLGPDGAYANACSPYYFTDRHPTAWGAGVNLDGPHSEHVRRFFIENAQHWVHEYHVDGLRLDATHAMRDDSPTHFLAELTTTVRGHARRPVLIVAEDHRNLAHMLQGTQQGGFGLDGVWADDFHHQIRVHTARDREGYYEDYDGTTVDIAATIRQGWFYTGQHSKHLGVPRGTPAGGLPPAQFVVCIQNHDQIGNRADGARLHHEIDAATYRAVSALLLLLPETPLLFMGQEWAVSTPFQFFTDHHAELGRLVTEGRRREFAAFRAFADPAVRARIPDPQAAGTFERSRLSWDEQSREPHASTLRLYRRLLEIRRACTPMMTPVPDALQVTALDAQTVALRLQAPPGAGSGDTAALFGNTRPGSRRVRGVHVVARLTGSGRVRVPLGAGVEPVLTTEDPPFAPHEREPVTWSRMADEPDPAGVAHEAAWEIAFARPGAAIFVDVS